MPSMDIARSKSVEMVPKSNQMLGNNSLNCSGKIPLKASHNKPRLSPNQRLLHRQCSPEHYSGCTQFYRLVLGYKTSPCTTRSPYTLADLAQVQPTRNTRPAGQESNLDYRGRVGASQVGGKTYSILSDSGR